MIARLGQVLFWAGAGLAFLVFVPGNLWLIQQEGFRDGNFWLLTSASVVIWLIGRACLFIFAGR